MKSRIQNRPIFIYPVGELVHAFSGCEHSTQQLRTQ